MEFTKYDMFAYQLLDYLVTKHNYQIIRVQQHKDDIWLMNAEQELYPVIRISSKPNETTLNDTDYIRNVHRVILNLIHREGPIIILNTNPESTPVENITMTQIRITPEEISNEKILSTFHDLKNVIHDSNDVENEIASLTREIEEVELVRQKKILASVKAKSQPRVTYVVMAISMLLSLVALGLTMWIGDHYSALTACGAYYKMNIVAAHEYWRLLTAGFLHQGLIVLLVNMAVLLYIGKCCEHVFSRGRYAMILLSSMVVGNVFLFISESNALAMGIGTGIAGVVGAYVVQIVADRAIRHPLVLMSLSKIVVSVLILLMLPGLSLYAYLGGFISGVLLGILFSKKGEWKMLRVNTAIASIMLAAAMIILVLFSRTVEPVDREFDASIVSIYRHTPLNSYADYLQRCYNKQYRLE